MPVLVVRWCPPRKCTGLFSELKLLHLPCYCSFSAMQIIRPLLIFLVSQAVFSSIEYFLKMNKKSGSWMHTLSNFSSISFSSSERRAMIRSLASRGWPSLISRGSKGWKNKMEVCRGVGTLQVYINAINFITNNSVSFSNQTDIFAPNRSRFIYFLRVSYFKEKTHIYTNNVEM